MSFSVTDLFIVGLGLDITGALLLVRGLLLPPATIARLATWYGVKTGDTLDRCENRVDAIYGGFALFAGFLLQAVGYVLSLSGAEEGRGSARVLTAVALGLLAVAASLAVYFATRKWILKRTLVSVAKSREGSGENGNLHWPQSGGGNSSQRRNR